MKQNFNAVTDKKQQAIAAMMTLESQIGKLAPHPDKPQGMMTARKDSRAAMATDTDAMPANLLIQSFFGAAFGEVATAMNVPAWAQQVQWDNIVDVCDEVFVDRANEHNGQKYEMGVKKALSGTFDSHSRGMAMDAFYRDLPERDMLEHRYMELSKDLDQYEKFEQTMPRPTFH